MRKYIYHITFIFLFLYLYSCESVKQVEVPEYDKRTIIEGVISDLGSYVKMHQQGEPPVILDGAEIHIKNSSGIDYLIPFTDDLYQSESAEAITNLTYNIEIAHDGQLITGSSKTPFIKYIIDTVRLNRQEAELNIEFDEHTALNNYACIIYTVNGVQIAPFVPFSDEFHVGTTVIQKITIPTQINIGDIIKITLYTINEESYEYLADLTRIQGQFSDPQLSHYNPIGNLSGNVLGFFMACLENNYTLLVEE